MSGPKTGLLHHQEPLAHGACTSDACLTHHSIGRLKFSRLINTMAFARALPAANEEFSCAREDYKFV